MIAVIRISGQVKLRRDVKETLFRMRLRKKYSCVVLPENEETISMLKKIENFVAYGKINKETLKELIEKRGKTIGKQKINSEKIVTELTEGKTMKKLKDFGLKPFFRLHPPRKGINSKKHFPKGVLGDNKEKINDLIKRML